MSHPHRCKVCDCTGFDKGRALDGRRVYRCQNCGQVHSTGLQGRERRYSRQRPGDQFADTGAASQEVKP